MEIVNFEMADGERISTLRFESTEEHSVVIHIHANSYVSNYYSHLARALSKVGITTYLIDLRGNGSSSGIRGHADYVGQYEDDISSLIKKIKSSHSKSKIILGGHSGGSMIALKYGERSGFGDLDAIYQFSPIFINHKDAESKLIMNKGTVKPQLKILNFVLAKLVSNLRSLNVIKFPRVGVPLEGRVYNFSYNAMQNYKLSAPSETYKNLNIPMRVFIGSRDEVTDCEYVKRLSHSNPYIDFSIIEKSDHINIVRKSQGQFLDWVTQFNNINKDVLHV